MSRRNRRFSTVRTEGGLLPQDLLSRIQADDKNLSGLTPESYHLGPHERIGEAVNRAWSRLTAAWRAFQEALAKEPAAKAIGLTRERWLLPLFQELGYGRLPRGSTIEVDGKSYAVSHMSPWAPVHLLGVGVDLDRRQAGVAGAAKSSPHGLMQQFLNRSDKYLWGFVSNGLQLRVLRDHRSLTRQAYVEFDLQALMEGEQYSDFLLLWMVCHQSRVEGDKPADCWLERWFTTSRDEGVRALDKLRGGVEKAIESFGTGFLAHQANAKLRTALESGELDKQEYYRQVLRLVYRLIFLFVAEERDALLDPKATDAARSRYLRFYATRRLLELSGKRRGSPHCDLWQGLRLVMSKLDDGCPEFALPALGSRLWGPTACPWLMDADCSNEHLLDAVRHISNIEEARTRYPVNWRNVGADELGSIYEGLLELHPCINKEAATFVLGTAAGHERKTTGSYYTPTELVDCLLNSALDPVLDEACKKPSAEAAILDLKVCDPACGSGHFLVAAARRIAKRLAAVRAGEDEPSPREVQRALRDVVGRCVYGVDVNPMAVELCKVSLWMEAIEPGRPLSFLDSHIQCGNALLGATPALMAGGIPDDAFNPIEGDDKDFAKKLKARNRKERKSRQLSLAFPPPLDTTIVDQFLACDERPDVDLAAVREHETCWLNLQRSNNYRDAKFRADAWCGAFMWPREPGEAGDAAITEDVWRRLQNDASTASPAMRRTVRELARQYRFFHWHLAFPQVFGSAKEEFDDDDTTGWTGGFDVVLGNPPWERIKLQEKEFFASRAPDIANASTAAKRRRAIAALQDTDPAFYNEYLSAVRSAEAESEFVRATRRYPLCGRGDVNTYALFAETDLSIVNAAGRVAFLAPSGIATENTTRFFFGRLMREGLLVSFFSFYEIRRFFPSTDSRVPFCIITIQGRRSSEDPIFVFDAMAVADVHDADRRVRLSAEDIKLINPNTETCPTFRCHRDAEVTKEIYRQFPVLLPEGGSGGDGWAVSLGTMFHLTNDSHLFVTREEITTFLDGRASVRVETNTDVLLPLYEAKMIDRYHHRFGDFADQDPRSRGSELPSIPDARLASPSYFVQSRYWVSEQDVLDHMRDIPTRWLFAWRDITNAASERTTRVAVLPQVGIGNSAPHLWFAKRDVPAAPLLLAVLNSFVLDFVGRQKVAGLHLNFLHMRQFPVPPPAFWAAPCGWTGRSIGDFVRPRVLELVYTSWDLHAFAVDHGWDGPPFRWHPERRFLLQCELDAAMFHLFAIAKDDAGYILESFPLVRRSDERLHGRFQTKLRILEAYDEMQRATETGEPYRTLLEPPPADPRVAYDESTRPYWIEPSAPAKVIPFRRPAPRLPTWGPDILPAVAARLGADDAGAWGSDLSGDDLLRYALAAVLRVLPEPWASVDVQRAVIAVVWPNALASQLDSNTAGEFRRLVGAADLSRPVEASGDWQQQVRLAISHKLMRVENGRWAAGPDVDDAPDVALTARATVAVAWMLSEHRDDGVFEPLEALLA